MVYTFILALILILIIELIYQKLSYLNSHLSVNLF